MSWEGVLPVWKPAGFTSHDIVAIARRTLKMKRIGHTGTLDPAVTGVLPLCLGRATRIVEYLQQLPKRYEAELIIGYSTDTEDTSGTITSEVEQVRLTPAEIKQVVESFVGEISQIPPMYSAVRVAGKRLYELARSGVEVERQSRNVTIHAIERISIDVDQQYPKVKFSVHCSKGTYIRTLCADIGQALGYPAVMSQLTRTHTGKFSVNHCLTLEQIEQFLVQGQLSKHIIPLDRAIDHLDAVTVPDETAMRALQGQRIARSLLTPSPLSGDTIRLYTAEERFIGIFTTDDEQVRPVKIFS